jgi:hypothetical protein
MLAYQVSLMRNAGSSLFHVGELKNYLQWWKCECNEGELMINTWCLWNSRAVKFELLIMNTGCC